MSAFNELIGLSLFAIITVNGDKATKKSGAPVFDSIRKPTPPPSRKIGGEKPEEKLRPSLRKTKHKKRVDPGNANGDL